MRGLRHAFIGGALAFAAFAVTLSGVAQASTPKVRRDPAAAEALFEQGRRALANDDLETACAKFAESQRLDPGVGTLMNWANCTERQGRVATAWQRWREALDQLPADDDRVAFARQRLEALEPRLPRLSIALRPGAPPDAQVKRDGVVLGRASLGTLLPVDPGVRSITVHASGFEARSFRLSIAEGETKSIEVEPGEPRPPAPSSTSSAPSGSTRRTVGWGLIGAGAAGVITGVVTGLMVEAKQEDVDANCGADGCNDRGLDAASDGKTLLWVNAIAWGAGIGGLGAGTFLVLSSREASSSPRVGVMTSPRGFGFAYRNRF